MTFERRHLVVAGVGATLVLFLVTGAIAASFDSGRHRLTSPHTGQQGSLQPATGSSVSLGSWTSVAPATTVPAGTPVQQQYDQAFEQGFASKANRQAVATTEGVSLPSPGIAGGWPTLTPAYTPDGWTRMFISGLLDIDFVDQRRQDLGAWLVAQEAPDLMPGVPAAAQLGGLYLTLMDPSGTGQPSPIPPATQWQQYAAAGVRWSVTDLQVQPDPQWQSMIAAGWQPIDLYASVEDVSGLLDISQGSSTTPRTFSVVLQLGSAHWHRGYGTALVSGWKET